MMKVSATAFRVMPTPASDALPGGVLLALGGSFAAARTFVVVAGPTRAWPNPCLHPRVAGTRRQPRAQARDRRQRPQGSAPGNTAALFRATCIVFSSAATSRRPSEGAVAPTSGFTLRKVHSTPVGVAVNSA